jgi:hypothetical protein
MRAAISKIFLCIVLPLAVTHMIYGCSLLSTAVKEADDVNDPADDKALHDCRALARAVKADSGSGDAGLQAYLSCVKEAGI